MSVMIANHVQKMINNYIFCVVEKIANRYGIPRQELMDLIKNVEATTPSPSPSLPSQKNFQDIPSSKQRQQISTATSPVSSNNKKQLSGYVKFCKEYRQHLKDEIPTLKFGDISKELGKRWSLLSPSEKKKYDVTNTEENNKTQSQQSVTCANKEQYTEPYLQKKTLNDLKDICGNFDLKKTGRKDTLIQRILEYVQQQSPSTSNNIVDENQYVNIDQTETEDDNNPLIFYENDSMKSSDDVSTTSSTSFILDDDNDLSFDYNDN